MKRDLLWIAFGVLVVVPCWLLATESGLRVALYAAERLTGDRLSVGAAEGRLLGDVTLRELTYRTEAAAVQIARADLNLRLSRLLLGRLQAETLQVQALVIDIRAQPEGAPAPERTPLSVRTPIRLAVEDGTLTDFRLRLPEREWQLPEARFGARWRDEWFTIGTLKAVTLEAGALELHGCFGVADDRLHFEQLEISGPGEVRADGTLALADEADSALRLEWKDLRSPRADLLPWLASPHGALSLKGPLRNFAWTVEGHVHLTGIPGELAARGRGNRQSLTLQRAELKTLDGRVRADGRLDWSQALRAQLVVDWERINPGAQFKDWAGRLSGKAAFTGEWRDATPRLEFDGAFHDSQLRGYPFALQVAGRTEDRKVFLKDLTLQSGASTLHAQGQLLPEMALTGELRSTDLASLWAGLAGRGQLQAGLRGTLAAPQLELRGTVEDLVFEQYRATRAALDARLAPQGHSDFSLRLDDVQAGLALRSLSLTGAGTRRAHRGRLSVDGAEGSVAIALQGRESGGAWRGRLTEARVAPAQGAPWSLEEPAALSYAGGRLVAEPICLSGGDSRACAELELAAGRQRVAFRLREFDLQHLRPWLPGEWNVTGTLTGTAALRIAGGELAEIGADLAGSAGSVEGGGVKLEYGPGGLRVQPEEGKLHATLLLRPAGGEVTGDVWIASGGALLDRPMLGDLRMRLPDLAWLPVLSPEIASAQGALDADLHVSGTPRSPSLDGRLNLTGGRVQLATPGIELTDLTASFERGHRAPLSLRAAASSGGGRLAIEGQLKTLQPQLAGEITVRGDNVQGFNTPEIRAWLSPDLKLLFAGGTARLSGELRVPRAEITPRQLEGGGVGPSTDQVLVTEEEASEQAGLAIESEVRIVLGEAVRFDGLGLKTRLTGAITAFDDPGRPTRGRGELRLDGGRYKAYGQELQIETGRLIFGGGPVTDPAIDLKAVRKPREDIKVGLRARGTLDQPEFSLFSEPAMSQEEQLSWLVLGRSLSATLSGGQRTQLAGAALSLGLTGGDYLAQQLAPRLGFDEVSVGAKPGETADLARLTIGKYLSPKLFVSYGVGLFQPGHFFRMQYDLGRRFKLVGESGVQQGGDLLYSIER